MSSKLWTKLALVSVLLSLNFAGTAQVDLYGPSLTSQPSPVTHFSNSVGLTLTCAGSGPKPLTTHWLSSTGEDLPQIPGIREQLQNGSLHFGPFKPEDYIATVHNGQYRCSVRNPVGTILSSIFSIRAIVDHPFEVAIKSAGGGGAGTQIPGEDDEWREGSPALLECRVQPSFYSQFVRIIAWKAIDQFGHEREISLEDSRYQLISDGSLLIFAAKFQQLFVCIGQSTLTSKLQSSAPFLLKSKPIDASISQYPRFIIIEQNGKGGNDETTKVFPREDEKTTDLICLAVGSPSPSFRWEKIENGKVVPVTYLQSSGSSRMVVGIGPLLRLTNDHKSGHSGNNDNHLSATYRCEVTSALGSITRNYTVVSRPTPQLRVEPERLVTTNGQTVEFSCKLETSPGAEDTNKKSHLDFIWFKDGKLLQRSSRVKMLLQKLLIFNTRLADQGVYQCFAQIQISSVDNRLPGEDSKMLQASAMLLFQASAPELVQTFISQSLQPGPSVSLKCSAVGNPVPVLSWFIDGVLVSDGGGPASFSSADNLDYLPSRFWREHQHHTRFSIGGASTSLNSGQPASGEILSYLNISEVHGEDSGVYTCVASNIVGIMEHSARVNIFGQIFVKEMSPLILVAGQNVQIPCYYGGFPVDKIVWQKDSRNLVEFAVNGKRDAGKFSIFPNGTLQIIRIATEVDKGRYTCQVSNRKGEVASGHVDVNVMRPPVISTFKFDENLKEGQRTSVSCNVISGDLPIDITWWKDGHPLALEHGRNITENKMRFLSVLIFDELRHEHSGEYTCSAENAAQTVKLAAKLEVRVPPKWIREPQDNKVILRTSHLLPCSATGVPPPVISWYREMGGIRTPVARVSHHQSKLQVLPDGTLEIFEMEEGDAGTYSCEAVNSVSNAISRSIRLEVIIPAKVSGVVRSVIVAEGAGTLLQCQVRGDRPLEVVWKRDGILLLEGHKTVSRVVQVNSTLLSAELRVGETTLDDSGQYQCIASNHFGRDQDTITLEVKARPAPPENFLVEEIGSRFIRLRWSLVASSGKNPVPVTSFILQWKRSQATWESGDVFNMSVQSPASHAVIEMLSPVTNYDVKILASNDIGQSLPTEPLVVLTLPEAPSGPPTNISALPVTPKSIIVRWEAPEVAFQHGSILGYQVICVLQNVISGHSGNKTVILDQKWEQQAEVPGLRPNAPYRISVRAYNSAGMGPESPYIFIQTPEGAPDSPPLNLQCEPLSPKSLQVQWEPPPFTLSNGHILGYKVIYLPLQAERLGEKPEVKKTSNKETTLHGLKSFTSYAVKTLAYTVGGESETSESVICTTEEDVPDEPQDIKVVLSTQTAVLITWLPPERPNGVIQKYTIFWKSDDSEQVKEKQFVPLSPGTTSTTLDVEQLFLEIRRLKEKNQYSFWVTAATNSGAGRASRTETVQMSPQQKIPARVASFPVIKNAGQDEPVRLPCKVVGIPVPKVAWFKNDAPIVSQGLFRNGSLFIARVKDSDEGVYTCRAENELGSDEIQHRIVISRPPGTVQIYIGYVTDSSMQIHWDPPEKADPPLTGYILQYSSASASSSSSVDWRSVRLGPRLTSYSLENLQCGTAYLFRLSGENQVGRGDVSAVLQARTNGNVPEASPRLTEILDGNGTMIRIDLNRWPDGGCPITNFHIEYKRDHQREMQHQPGSPADSSTASHQLLQWMRIYRRDNGTRVFIFQTEPNSRYQIRIQVENDAGTQTKTFSVESHPDFFTNYAKVLERVEVEERMNGGSSYVPFYTDPHVVVPIVSAVICTFAIAVCVLMLIRRKNQAKSSTEWKFNQSSSQHTWLSSSSDAGTKCGDHLANGLSVPKIDENMSIYATLNSTQPIPMTIRDSTVRLQSFGQHDNYDAPTHNLLQQPPVYPAGGKRSNPRRKSSSSSPPPELCMQQVACHMENFPGSGAKIQPPREFRSTSSSQLFHYPNSDSDDNREESRRTPAVELEDQEEDMLYHDYSCPYQFTPAGGTGPPGEFHARRREMLENSKSGASRPSTLKKKRTGGSTTAKARNRGPEYFD